MSSGSATSWEQFPLYKSAERGAWRTRYCMIRAPLCRGGCHLIPMLNGVSSFFAITSTFSGASGCVSNGSDRSDHNPRPAWDMAYTWKKYRSPARSPSTVIGGFWMIPVSVPVATRVTPGAVSIRSSALWEALLSWAAMADGVAFRKASMSFEYRTRYPLIRPPATTPLSAEEVQLTVKECRLALVRYGAASFAGTSCTGWNGMDTEDHSENPQALLLRNWK
mmetsp:Transcript_25331/g.65047  ORF Transcript_25331/g.65047 Transcript_25331/m.65047 type:complete len:222 (-) Transcript_25331:1700-2365(-)